MENLFTLNIKSEAVNLTLVENQIEQLLDSKQISDEVYGNVIVALTEATLNAIRHGNKENPDKMVKVSATKNEQEIEFVVEDEGPGFDYENLPDPTAPENLEKVNGRGIFIITSLSDNVEFENNGAKLKMSFSLKVNEGIVA